MLNDDDPYQNICFRNLTSSLFLLSWCFTSTETIWLIRDGEGWGEGGGSGTYEYLALRPAKTEETVSHRRNDNVEEVGTPP